MVEEVKLWLELSLWAASSFCYKFFLSPKEGTFFMEKDFTEKDIKYMQEVFNLAKKGRGFVSPNPLVGALVVKDQIILGQGWHMGPGKAHAEIVAIEMAGKEAKGADLYVNLEPCCHYGRTPPCVDTIIEKGIKRVFISNRDPNPLVNGQGMERLKVQGIEIIEGLLEKEGLDLNGIFFKNTLTKKPYVALKAASSLDGKISTSTGESKWITGEESRMDAQILRLEYDSILVGINTVLADDPLLTCRLKDGRNPIRIILDNKLRIPLEAKLLNLPDSKVKTMVITSQLAPKEKIKTVGEKARLVILPKNKIEIEDILDLAFREEIYSILVEGGAGIHESFISKKVPDKYYLYFAPLLIGGRDAGSFFAGQGFAKLNEAARLELASMERKGKDIKMILYPEKG